MDDQDNKKKLNGDAAELPRPGAVSVAGAAPQGKPSRVSSRALMKNPPPPGRSDDAASGQGNETNAQLVAHLHNSGSNLEPLEPEALMEPNGTVAAARPAIAPSTSVARSTRRNDSKAVIRQEMNSLRSQGLAQGPGAVSVSTAFGSAAVAAPAPAPPSNSKAAIRQEMNALRSQGLAQGPGAVSVSTASGAPAVAAPTPAPASDSKAAIKREIEVLRAHPEMNRPGAHSVATSAEAASSRKGGALSRSERPSRRALKESEDQQSQRLKGSITATSVSQPGAQPSTAESTAAAEKALLVKTQAARPAGAVQASAADDKSKTLKVDTTSASSNTTSDAVNKKAQDEKFLSSFDSKGKILDDTAKGIPLESSKDAMTPKDAYNQKNDLNRRNNGYDDDDNHNGDSGMAEADGLVAAQVIDEEELEAQYQAKMMKSVVSAEIVSEDELKERGRCWKMSCCCLLLIGIIMAIAIPLSKKNDPIVITLAPTPSPTEQPEYDYLVDLFYPYSGDALEDNTTAQYQALQWIAYEDPLGLPIKESNATILIERYSAAVLYYSLNGEGWNKDYGFLGNTSICNWTDTQYGIYCYEGDEVAKWVYFDANNLIGTLPSEILGFSRLSTLSMTYDQLRGTLPSELGDLTSLSVLQVEGQQLTGTIPTTYGKLRLQAFNVESNQLNGTIPTDMFEPMVGLKYLSLTQNQFSGPLPEIRTQIEIFFILMDGNLFDGTIPHSYFAQPSLIQLSFSDNLLTGSIPEQIRGLTSLAYFYGSQNSFSGTIPPGLDTLKDLEEVLLDENMISGTIPSELGQCEVLAVLSLASNQLTGPLPSELANMPSLISLSLASNEVTGTIPSTYSLFAGLSDFDVSYTDIVGGLEETFCTKTTPSTSVTADCLGNSSSTITCTCCSKCCNDDTCEISLPSTCEAKSAQFILAPDRGTTCDCLDDGATMSCTDTACESCNVNSTVCAKSTEYGYSFDDVTGQQVQFRNTIQYTKGRNDTVVFTKDANATNCELEVNGEKCNICMMLACKSSLQGFQINCENLPDPANVFTCEIDGNSKYLEVFYFTDFSSLSGCPPVLVDLRSGNDS